MRKVLEKRWKYEKHTVIVFINVQKAYGKYEIKHVEEFEKMCTKGVPERVKNLYNMCKTKVRIKEKYTESFIQ